MTRRWATRLCLGLLLGAHSTLAAAAPSNPPPPSPELVTRTAAPAAPVGMHPPVVLRDDTGRAVLESGASPNAGQSCGQCHDAAWIGLHSHPAHAKIGCFDCHVSAAKDSLTELGAIKPGPWQIGPPTPQACGACHGRVHDSTEPLTLEGPLGPMTEAEGTVFAGQHISESALNIAHKETLARPWDVHAERLLACQNCHFTPNHPAYAGPAHGPSHLAFDARRLGLGEYLRRPDHRLASGSAMRRCEGCHDAPRVHGWLPRLERHLARLACESCHVPQLYARARAQVDWSMPVGPGEPRITYRGGAASAPAGMFEGYRPALLERADGKLAPHNLVMTWQWVAGEANRRGPVARELVERALFREGKPRPELIAMLDRDHDGHLAPDELLLDTREKVDFVRRRLVAEGAVEPELVGSVAAHAIHHGIAPGRYATRECRACHGPGSRLAEATDFAGPVPFGRVASWEARSTGSLARSAGGGLAWVPATSRSSVYVFGYSRRAGIDSVGLGALLLVVLATSTHGVLRWRATRAHRKASP